MRQLRAIYFIDFHSILTPYVVLIFRATYECKMKLTDREIN